MVFLGKTPAMESTGFLEATRKSLTSCSVQVQNTSMIYLELVNSSDNYKISGGDGSKDACKGDSGGPLVVKVCKWF